MPRLALPAELKRIYLFSGLMLPRLPERRKCPLA
jgi:hypothetical protein